MKTRLPHRSNYESALQLASRARRAASEKRWMQALSFYDHAEQCAARIRRAPAGIDVQAMRIQLAGCAGMIRGIIWAKEKR